MHAVPVPPPVPNQNQSPISSEHEVKQLRATLSVYQKELERIYTLHPELKRPVEDMGEEITTP